MYKKLVEIKISFEKIKTKDLKRKKNFFDQRSKQRFQNE